MMSMVISFLSALPGLLLILANHTDHDGVRDDDLSGVLAVLPMVAADDCDMIAEIDVRSAECVNIDGADAGELFAGVLSIVPDVGQVRDGAEFKGNIVLDADADRVIVPAEIFRSLFDLSDHVASEFHVVLLLGLSPCLMMLLYAI